MNAEHRLPGHTNPSGGGRASVALLALGGYFVLAGGIFYLPFALSPNAIQNDVYMTNLFLAPVFVLGGVLLLLVGLALFARSPEPQRGRWMRALPPALVGAGVTAVAAFLVGGRYESFPPGSVYWPPYLNGWLLAVTAAVAVGVAVAGWGWTPRDTRGPSAA